MNGETTEYLNETCFIIDKDYADKHNLILIDYIIDNDEVLFTIFRNESNCYFAVKGEY